LNKVVNYFVLIAFPAP